jgi:hypothetical protein
MTFPFDPRQSFIIVHAKLEGPSGEAILRLALDTGATSTLINAGLLVSLGYDPSLSTYRVQVTMGSSVEFLPQINVTRLEALGQDQTNLPILCHTLPPSAGVDGLLGLDFLRDQTLTLDFRKGEIMLG